MNRTPFFSLLAVLCANTASHAVPKTKNSTPVEAPAGVQYFEAGKVTEFSGDDLSLVLRTLARQAKLNIVVGSEVSGAVTARLENKTPREALEIIAKTNGLVIEDKKGILYVTQKNADGSAKTPKPESTLEETVASIVMPAFMRFYESLLDFEAKPETARKIAKAKRALYDALLAEGFSREESLQILLNDRGIPIPSLSK